MTHQQKWDAAVVAAAEIVRRHRATLPPGVEVYNNTKGEVDTSFQRFGGTDSTGGFTNLPAELTALINNSAGASAPGAGLTNQSSNFLSGLLGRSGAATPGASTLNANMSIDPTNFAGSSRLSSIATRDPYSSAFEDATQSAYEQRAADAMAQSTTGQEAVRGGQSRAGIGQGVLADRLAQGRGQEVRQAQLQDAGIVQMASNLFNQIEQARRGVQLGAQQQLGTQAIGRDQQGLGASNVVTDMHGTHGNMLFNSGRLLGEQFNNVFENLTGKGHQASSQRSFLPGCCFIFLQALNGELPWYIDQARRDYYTPRRKRGYKWMSKWLVPLMEDHAWVQSLVNTVIIKPFLSYGRWKYSVLRFEADEFGFLWWPYCWLWLTLWGAIGTVKGEK